MHAYIHIFTCEHMHICIYKYPFTLPSSAFRPSINTVSIFHVVSIFALISSSIRKCVYTCLTHMIA